MAGQGCQFGGGGGGQITLEDLTAGPGPEPEGESTESVSNSNAVLEEGDEQPEGEEGDRLFSYWQTIGRGHRVEVPREMAEPIQQLTRNNQPQDREMVPFAQISQKKKCDQVLYEKRRYEKAKWACVNLDEGNYEQATCLGFMKLMRYICGQNSSGLYLGMTLPIVTIVRTNQSRSELLSTVTVAYHLPGQFQDQIPQPSVADIQIEEWPANIVYTRPFNGVTNEDSILQEINQLAEYLDNPEPLLQDTFIIARYSNPAAPNHQNEIWFIQRP
ncbi:heme-binding protein soul3 [Callorhinchus milii]|uniref:heme-binding protein soul3 n=1 Tax=Callorhinchus milii TaxID=7868 RepID=UPI001C3FBD7C|nr:heme-binding protein soul3 [Callorhinchus milii]